MILTDEDITAITEAVKKALHPGSKHTLPDGYVNQQTALNLTGLSLPTFIKYVATGEIPRHRHKKRICYKISEIDSFNMALEQKEAN